MTVHQDVMAHLSKTKQNLLRTLKIRTLQIRLQRVSALLKAAVKQKGVKGSERWWQGQQVSGSVREVTVGAVGSTDPWLASEWDLANIWKGTAVPAVPGKCPQGQDDKEPSPETGTLLTLLGCPQAMVLIKQTPCCSSCRHVECLC